MRKFAIAGAMVLLSAGVYSAQQPAAPAAPAANRPTWAFPVQEGSLPTEPGPKKLPGSDKSYTPEEIDNLMAAPDWYPNAHPPAPAIVLKGHGGAMACGACHGPGLNGLATIGKTGIASPRLAGQHPVYIARQLYLFKDGSRNGMTSKMMAPVVKNLDDADIVAISAYLGSMEPGPTTK